MKGVVKGYYNFSLWITRLAYLNLLWIVFTLVGLIAFGFFPATVSMFAVTRKWIMGEEDVKIFRVFWDTYKKCFWKSNLIGFILVIVAYLLIMEFKILRAVEGTAYFVASYAVLTIFLLYSIVVVYIFPIFSHFKLKMFQYFKWAFVIGIVHPILTIFLLAGVTALNYIAFIYIPGLLFFFSGSVTAFLWMWGAYQTFEKYEAEA